MATNSPLHHKGYYGTIQYNEKDETGFPFHGQVLGTDMKYNGRTAQDLLASFILTVDQCADTSIHVHKSNVPRMVKSEEIIDMVETLALSDTNDILPALRKGFEVFLRKTTDYDYDFPSSHYNLHRLVQHAKSVLLDHLSKYAVVNCGVVIYAPEFIPDIPDYTLHLDYGMQNDTSSDGLRFLCRHLTSILQLIEEINLCSAELYIKHQTKTGKEIVGEAFTVQFPDIL